jgi:aerobic carbon-monoxide dehydrogenase medium subunit
VRAAPFAYSAPESVEAVLAELQEHGPDARILAGGQSLVPMMNLRLARFDRLIDVGRVSELAGVRRDGDTLVVGATTTHADLACSPATAAVGLLGAAGRLIGHGAIRNRGTFGGSLAHADPAAEWPAVATALDATLRIAGPAGERTARAREFFRGHFTPDLAPDELLVEATLPIPAAGTGWSFQELARQSGAFALVLVAALVAVDGTGAVERATIVVGACGERPLLADAAQLAGARLEPSQTREAAHALADALDPPDDIHASAADRRRMAAVLIERALLEAARRAAC